MSSIIVKNIKEKENEFDMAIIKEYEKDKKLEKIEIKPIEKLFNEYDI